MRFNQSTYSVDENGGLIQPVLVLSNRSSTDIKLRISVWGFLPQQIVSSYIDSKFLYNKIS